MDDAEYNRLWAKIDDAHVQIGRRDSMIKHLQEDNLATIHKISLLHVQIGRMGAVNEQLIDALSNALGGCSLEAAQATLDMAIEEKDNNYGE